MLIPVFVGCIAFAEGGMPQYNGCSNCGYSEHVGHGSEFCPQCGTKLSGPFADARDACPEERAAAWEILRQAREHFIKAGGKLP